MKRITSFGGIFFATFLGAVCLAFFTVTAAAGDIYKETFADSLGGWTLGTEWQIGSASAVGGFDPGTDNSPTDDNGVAGVVIGGSASTAALHGYYFLESPAINTSAATTLGLSYYRWLNTDSPAFMSNIVQVYNGSSWVTIWTSGSVIHDTSWTLMTHDVSPYINANFRVRFGFSVNSLSVGSVGSWNIDDVTLSADYANQAPSISTIPTQGATEGSAKGPIGFTVGDAETPVSLLRMSATSDDQSLVKDENIVFGGSDASRTVTITPEPGVSGTANITVRVNDSVSVTEETFALNVMAVPSVTGATTDEDVQSSSGLVLTPNDAVAVYFKITAITGGNLDQNDGATSITNGQFITLADGAAGLKFSPATNSTNYGSFSAQVSISTDDAGLGGAVVTATIVVTPVNDVPSFVKGANERPSQNSGSHTVSSWATAISPGPADESGQAVNFIVSNNNNALFSVQPAISATGTLTYTLASDTVGAATVTVQLHDDGGGSDTSGSQTFTITVPSRYGSGSSLTAGAGPSSLVLADFDADNAMDIVVGNFTNNTVSFIRGDGSGGFAAATNINVGNHPAAIGLGDFNGDGKRDLAVANYGDGTVGILLGSGKGFFWGMTNAVPATITVGAGPIALAIADVSRDGKMDIVVANHDDDTVSVLLGAGSGTLTNATGSPFSVGSSPMALALTDFTGDGLLDLAVVYAGSDNIGIFTGAGDGTFTPHATPPVSVGSNPRAIAFGDVNNDGMKDLVVANGNDDNVSVLLGVGDGTFSVTNSVTVGDNPSSVALVDMNGDGKLDLLVANEGANTVTLLLGNGNGTFQTGEAYAVGAGPSAVAARAFVSGLPSIVTANRGDGTVSFLSNIVPTAIGKSVSVVEGGSVSISLSGKGGSGPLTFTLITAPTNGVLSTNSVSIPTNAYPVTLLNNSSNVTYTPGANYYGGDRFTFAVDDGGVTSAAVAVTVNVVAVNERPSFELNTNLLVAISEDRATPYSVANFATNIVAGSGKETNQIVTFYITASNAAFFKVKPTLKAGVLSFQPAANSNGVQLISVYAKDNGGRANGGWDTSITQLFAITVTAVNDRPTISAIADRVAYEDRSTNISFTIGDIDNAVNSLTVTAFSSNTNLVPNENLLLGGSGASRTLLVTPVTNKNGFTYITNTVSDGLLSTSKVFKVTFTAVNDPPSFSMVGSTYTNARNSSVSYPGWVPSSSVSSGPADESAQKVTFTVTNNNPALFALQPAITTAANTLSFRPVTNAVGTATVTVVAKDSGNTLYGGVNSSTQTFTVSVTWRLGDLIVADRGPAGESGTIILVNTNTTNSTGAQTVITTNFYDPVALAFATNGDLIVVDYDAIPDDPINNRGAVYRINRLTLERTLISSGLDFSEPIGVAVEADNSILVADSDAFGNAGAVFRVNPSNGDKTLLSSSFTQLAGIAVFTNGNIYVTDQGAGSVIQVDAVNGDHLLTFSGGSFLQPVGIAVEPGTGDLIVVDKSAKKVIRVNAVSGDQTEISSDSHFVEPTHVAIAANGDFIVTDGKAGETAANHQVFRVNKTTGVATAITSGSISGAVLDQPRGVVVVR